MGAIIVKHLLSLSAFCTLSLLNAAEQKPNVLLILVDDFGQQDTSLSGSKFYETPNIDRLAKEGMWFTSAYSAHPVCSPSRAAILTGKNPCRSEVNITDWIPGSKTRKPKLITPKINNQLPLKEVTIAETLKKNGYSTFSIGKWHLGGEGYLPENQGFDVNVGGWERGSPIGGYYYPWKNPKLPKVPKGTYLTDYLTTRAIDLIKKRDKAKPFFMYMSFYTVHTRLEPCKRYFEKFKKKLSKLHKNENPEVIPEKFGAKTKGRQDNPVYASMVYAMDENVGRLLAELEKEGIDNNTIVIFTGDNGSLTTMKKKPGFTSCLPLRAGKGWTYEGGIRVPFIVKAPNVKPGRKSDTPVVGTDIYATVLDLCGIPLMPELHKDSVSIKPILYGASDSLTRKNPLLWYYPHYQGSGFCPGTAIRVGKWKLVLSYQDNSVELYDLSNDLGEKDDLSKKYPEKTTELLNQLNSYLDKVGAKRPYPRQ
jgi:arylsulfatase A-like enzyme